MTNVAARLLWTLAPACALGLALGALGPSRALAQLGPLAGHPMPQGPRPLHVLAAEADAAAIATIDAVETGRIRVRDAVALFGDPPARFELKRAPSSPPALEPGQRVLLLLRGARSPYLVVGAPGEQIALVGEAPETRLAPAFAALRAARPDPAAVRDLLLAWSDGDDPMLRPLAVAALVSPDAAFVPIPDALAAPRARRALDPSVEASRRLDAAAIAALAPAGVDALLAGTPVAHDPVGLQVYELALASGLIRERAAAVEAALFRGLASPDAAVRSTALRYARSLPSPRLRPAIEAAEALGQRPGGA